MAPEKSIPRYRAFDGPALFRQGFRPFFLAAGLWAALAVPVWIVIFDGTLELPSAFDPVSWHAHEMLFGFVVAAIAGFLLTAIPNWTGRMPLQGPPLMALFAIWVLGRVAMATSHWIGAGAGAVCDLAFLVALFMVVLREITAGRNWRNLPIPVALALLLAANVLMHAEALGLAQTAAAGRRFGIAVVVLLIGLIGGRIVPSFTRNWLARQGEGPRPAAFGWFDRIALGVTGLGLLLWIIAPQDPLTGSVLLAAGGLMLLRLLRWRGDRTVPEPLVWSLHVGYAWVPAGLLLTGAAALWPQVVSETAGIHALTAGAFGGMTLAVMTRATLGHTGRPLVADVTTVAIYGLVALAAAARIAAAYWPDAYMALLWTSAVAWVAAFGLFSLHYGRMLVGR